MDGILNKENSPNVFKDLVQAGLNIVTNNILKPINAAGELQKFITLVDKYGHLPVKDGIRSVLINQYHYNDIDADKLSISIVDAYLLLANGTYIMKDVKENLKNRYKKAK